MYIAKINIQAIFHSKLLPILNAMQTYIGSNILQQ